MSLLELSKKTLDAQLKYLEKCNQEQLIKYAIMACMLVEVENKEGE